MVGIGLSGAALPEERVEVCFEARVVKLCLSDDYPLSFS